jgi:N-acetylneuraminic acid mutarotase
MGSKPQPRHAHTAVRFGGDNAQKVLVWGGVSTSQPLNDMWLFNAQTFEWQSRPQIGDTPTPRFNHASASTPSALYIFGGYVPCVKDTSSFTNELWKYDFSEGEWMLLPMTLVANLTSGPSGRVGHTLTAIGENLILYAGKGEQDEPFFDTWEYDLTASTWNLTNSRFEARSLHSAVQMGPSSPELLIFGGMNINGEGLDSLIKYNSQFGNWSTMVAHGSPGVRYRHAALWRETSLYIFGGQARDSDTYLSDMWVFSTLTNEWNVYDTHGTQPARAIGMAAVSVGNSALLIGGLAVHDSNEIMQLNFQEKKWSRRITRGHLPATRILNSGNVVGDSLWIFGGETPDGKRLNDLWDFHLDFQIWTQHAPMIGIEVNGDVPPSCAVGEPNSPKWPQTRSGHMSVVAPVSSPLCGGQTEPLVIIGGLSGADNLALNDMWAWCQNYQQVLNHRCNHFLLQL